MATEVIKIIDPDNGSGTNYTSLSAWEAGEQGDLTGVRDEIAIAKCRCTGGTADDGEVAIDGWTTDSTRYIKVWTDPAEAYRHNGTYQSTKYRIGTKRRIDFYHIGVFEDFVRLEGLQFVRQTDGGMYMCVWLGYDRTQITDIRILNNIFLQTETNASYNIIAIQGAVDHMRCHVVNNIFIDFADSYGDGGIGVHAGNYYIGSDSFPWCIYNNTFSNCHVGIESHHNNVALAKNNIFSGCGTPCLNTFASGSGYNATDDSSIGYTVTGGATGDRVSQTFSFVDPDNDDFHLQSNDTGAKGYGTNLYNDANYPFQTDIDGQDRGGSGAVWDIGADEYVAAYPYYAYAQQ